MEQKIDHSNQDQRTTDEKQHALRDKHPLKSKVSNGEKHKQALDKKEIYGQSIPEVIQEEAKSIKKTEEIDDEGKIAKPVDELVDGPDEEDDPERQAIQESPKGRFKRFSQELGSGAYKTVYKAIDQDTGREVAWNVIKLRRLPKGEKKRIMEEISLIKNLKHDNIIHFISAWVVREREEVIFITELVTGGSLHQYLKRIKHPRLKVIKTWAREILKGLQYLHEQDTPIIHRDIKCDNIFINSNSGEIRIGDLGLSTTMKASHAKSVLGTPQFMAPELYEEHYGQSVDIYAFGMCLLEMVTLEQPYKECQNPAQVYKKVCDGIKPLVLDRIANPKVVSFIESCIVPSQKRPTARLLLESEFLTDLEGEENNEVVALLPPSHAQTTNSLPIKHGTPHNQHSNMSNFTNMSEESAPTVIMHQDGKQQNKPPMGGGMRRMNTVKNGHQSMFKKQNPPAAKMHHHHRPDLHVNTQRQNYGGVVPQSAKYTHHMGGLGAFNKMQAQQYNLHDQSPDFRRHADSITQAKHHQVHQPSQYKNSWRRQNSEEEMTVPTAHTEVDDGTEADEEKTDNEMPMKRERIASKSFEPGAVEADEEDNTEDDEEDNPNMNENSNYRRVQSSGSIASLANKSPTKIPRKVEITVNWENKDGSSKEIIFEFDMERDSAQGVVQEMGEQLQLSYSDKQNIVQQIQMQVAHKYKTIQKQQHDEMMQFEGQKKELFMKLEEVEKNVTEMAQMVSALDPVRLKNWQEQRSPEDEKRIRAIQDLLNWRKRLVEELEEKKR